MRTCNLDPGASIAARFRSAFAGVLAAIAAFAFSLAQTGATAAPRSDDASAEDIIQQVKPSVVAVGTYQRLRQPAFLFQGTGFAVGDGSLIATNAHVVPLNLDRERRETLVIFVPDAVGGGSDFRTVSVVRVDRDNDVALLSLDGSRLPPLKLSENTVVPREGRQFLFTGFPLGPITGLLPITHRAMVSAVAPMAMPKQDSSGLDVKTIRALSGANPQVMQLDATAYPGNSGSPLYDSVTGEVVGVVNSVLVKSLRESPVSHPSGITFALPVATLRALVSDRK